jgi:hypothetical protein
VPVTARLSTGRKKQKRGFHNGRPRPKKQPPYGRALYPARSLGFAAYKLRVEEALNREAAAVPRGKERKDITKKAKAFHWCGSLAHIRECVCGTARDATGVPVSASKRCGQRSCPFCERYRSSLLRNRVMAGVMAVPLVNDYRWRLLTFSPWWNDVAPESYTVQGLQIRVRTLAKVFRKVVRMIGSLTPDCAAFMGIENAHGHIHAHALVYTPWIDHAWLEAEFRKALPTTVTSLAAVDLIRAGSGFVDIRDKGPGGRTEETARAVLEATKYSTKSASPLAESWLAGSPRECMDPTLAARWTLATKGVRLTEAYGRLRGLMNVEDEDADLEEAALRESTQEALAAEEADPSCVCRACGCHGEWRDAPRELLSWVRECHARGSRALFASRWEPPELGVELISRPRPPP